MSKFRELRGLKQAAHARSEAAGTGGGNRVGRRRFERCRNSFAVVDGHPGTSCTCSVCGRRFKVTAAGRLPVHKAVSP